MRHFIVLAGLCLVGSGCGGVGSEQDATAVYETVFHHEIKGGNNAEAIYVFLDGNDPEPALLDRLAKKLPGVTAGSKAPKGKATRISVSDLKWLDRNTAEVQGGSSNGMDGHLKIFRVVRKGEEWVVEKAQTSAIS